MMRSELWFILAFVTMFSSVPAVNYFTDPLELYGDAKSYLSFNTNESMSRRLQVVDLVTSAGRLTEPNVILGTSHVGRGIDSCESNIGKLWLPGMRLNETISVFSTLVMNSKDERLIVLDIAALAESEYLAEQELSLQDSLFNLEIFQWSLLKLLGLQQEPAGSDCGVDQSRKQRDLNAVPESFMNAFSTGISVFQVGINQIVETCQNPKVNVAIVLFPFHVSPDTLQLTKGLEGFLDGSQSFSPIISNGGCQIRIINLGSRDFQTRMAAGTLGMDKDGWYDFNHFRPEAGRRFLATILHEMEEDL